VLLNKEACRTFLHWAATWKCEQLYHRQSIAFG